QRSNTRPTPSRAPTRPMSGSFPSNINFFKMHQQFHNLTTESLIFINKIKYIKMSQFRRMLAHFSRGASRSFDNQQGGAALADNTRYTAILNLSSTTRSTT
ncbi:hypothetical protein, partial [Burkholderia ubonensis]|uniref:hypothetical protein n=1 Tax=Burkholderia ubonensis TaxID=101571 RepID=UPI001E2EB905